MTPGQVAAKSPACPAQFRGAQFGDLHNDSHSDPARRHGSNCDGRLQHRHKRQESLEQGLKAYSFVPAYPARSSIKIGDIRLHRRAGGSQTFDSRLLWSASEHGIKINPLVAEDAVLPGLDVMRLGAFDIRGNGLFGLLSKVLGTRIEATDALNIALKGMSTAEVSDPDVAQHFLSFVTSKLAQPGSDRTSVIWASAS